MKRIIVDETPANAETVDADHSVPLPPEGERPALRVLAGRYEILGLIGSGGMGTVYRARDRELDEVIALKMLRKRLAASSPALDRFRREVKLARRVTHKNVARTFDIAEHAEGKFLTMEFIDGEMLRSKLARTGTGLPVSDAVRIGRDLCAGLGAAHAAGVLHRDLKPENIIIARDGRAVITDFGIARALSYAEAAKSAGDVVGTPAYMAPEQLENAELDERTDVYALGVVLYELLTGEVPWAHESPIKAAIARMREAPPDVRKMRASLPESIALVVAKCMATKRDARYANVDEVSEALGQVVAPPPSSMSLIPAPRRESSRMAVAQARAAVAVLPLVVDNPDVAHFASAITEDIVDLLGVSPDLLVVHAPSASLDARAAGRALGVHAVVTGTFSYAATHVEVKLQVVTVEDGFEIWAHTFKAKGSDLEKIPEAAAAGIAAALSTRVTSFRRTMPTDRVAYDLYLRGRAVFLRGWYSANEAVRLFGEAAARSPENATIAAAYARALARAYGVENDGDPREAQVAAERAIVLDPSRAEARIALAMVYLYRSDGVGAAAELVRALDKTSPTDPDVLELLGRLRAEVGPLGSAIDLLDVVLAREPAFAEARYTLARLHALQRDWAKVDATLGPAPTVQVERIPALLMEARLLMWRGDEEARERCAARLAEIADLELRLRMRQVLELVLGVGARRAMVADDQMRLADNFPTDTSTNQRRASFNAQIRAEVLCAAGAEANAELVCEAVTDADANGLLDLVWLENCPLLDPIRSTPVFEGARKRTAMRAARVRDALDGR